MGACANSSSSGLSGHGTSPWQEGDALAHDLGWSSANGEDYPGRSRAHKSRPAPPGRLPCSHPHAPPAPRGREEVTRGTSGMRAQVVMVETTVAALLDSSDSLTCRP